MYSTFIIANGLLSDYCPLAYYLGNGYFVYGTENCNEKTSFFCNNSDIGRSVFNFFLKFLRSSFYLYFGSGST